MIMVGRSLVCGSRGGAPSPVPRPRAGRLPERRHERAGAAAGVRGGRGVAARAARAGPQQQALVRAPGRADRRAARARRRSARRAPSRTWRSPARPPTASTPCCTPLDLQPGDEIVTSDEEHPGVLAPLATARDTRGVSVRVVPFEELPDELAARHTARRHARTSHGRPAASWTPRRSRRPARSCCSTAPRVSAPCRSTSTRSAATSTPPRARSGSAARAESATCTRTRSSCPSLPAPWSGYHALEWSEEALVPALQPDARRLATGFPAPHHVEWAHASLDVLEAAGFDEVHDRAARPAPSCSQGCSRDRGIAVAPPRGLHARLVRGARPRGLLPAGRGSRAS